MVSLIFCSTFSSKLLRRLFRACAVAEQSSVPSQEIPRPEKLFPERAQKMPNCGAHVVKTRLTWPPKGCTSKPPRHQQRGGEVQAPSQSRDVSRPIEFHVIRKLQITVSIPGCCFFIGSVFHSTERALKYSL